MRLHDLQRPTGAHRRRKRVGRGEASGHGKNAGRGGKGQTKRSGRGKPHPGFEGGQTPMFRRMPKRGFTNIFAKHWAVINLDALATRFPAGTVVDLDALRKVGLATRKHHGVRVLARGDVAHPLTVRADHFSQGAKEKIERAGGQALGSETAPA